MTDVHDIETRSYNMSQIKGKDTKPELLVRKFLFSQGLRYRLHNKELPGKPDITLRKFKAAIFINGCFWHGHKNCNYFSLPKTKTEWWMEKIKKTKERDAAAILSLKEIGWNTFTIWECELKSGKHNITLNTLLHSIITGQE